MDSSKVREQFESSHCSNKWTGEQSVNKWTVLFWRTVNFRTNEQFYHEETWTLIFLCSMLSPDFFHTYIIFFNKIYFVTFQYRLLLFNISYNSTWPIVAFQHRLHFNIVVVTFQHTVAFQHRCWNATLCWNRLCWNITCVEM